MPKWNWPDARGYIALASFFLAIMVIWIMKEDARVREDEFFQTIATILIANGWMSVVNWAYAATKGGGELAERNANIVQETATTAGNDPKKVVVVNKKNDPVPTEEGETK